MFTIFANMPERLSKRNYVDLGHLDVVLLYKVRRDRVGQELFHRSMTSAATNTTCSESGQEVWWGQNLLKHPISYKEVTEHKNVWFPIGLSGVVRDGIEILFTLLLLLEVTLLDIITSFTVYALPQDLCQGLNMEFLLAAQYW